MGMQTDLLPCLLPPDVALLVMARVSPRHYSACGMTHAYDPHTLLQERRRLGCTEAWLFTALLHRNAMRWILTTLTDSCPLPPMPPSHHPLHGFHALLLDGLLYVVGGFLGDGRPTSRVSAFDACTNAWASLPEMAFPRANFACGVIRGKLYVAGGEQHYSPSHAHVGNVWDGSTTRPLRSAEAYDPAVGAWSSLPDMRHAQFLCGGLVRNGTLVVSGFLENEYLDFEEISEVYDPHLNEWQVVESDDEGEHHHEDVEHVKRSEELITLAAERGFVPQGSLTLTSFVVDM